MTFIKVLVVGEVATGKTSLVARLVNNTFQLNYKATLGCEFATKQVSLNSQSLQVQLWDLAGQDRLGALTRLYCRDAHGVLVVGDVSRVDTVGQTTMWKSQIAENVAGARGLGIPMVVCLNKCDLVATQEHATEQLQALIKENGFTGGFFTSAKTGYNVTEAFTYLLTMIVKQRAEVPVHQQPAQPEYITLALKHIETKTCC